MSSPSFFPPSIRNRKISILLYADDLVLISQNQKGLKRMLTSFVQLCMEELLSINYSKTKIMVFGKGAKKHKWMLDGHEIEQVNSFKYLGINFSQNLAWKQHLDMVSISSARHLGMLKKFFYARGGQLIPPTIKVYEAKILPHLLYGAELWGDSVKGKLEIIQNKFLRQLMGLPPGTPAAHIRAELGLASVATRIDLAYFRHWQRIYAMDETALIKDCWHEQLLNGGWAQQNCSKLKYYNIDLDKFLHMSSKDLREWLFDWEAGQDKAFMWESRFSIWYPYIKCNHAMSTYLETLTSSQLRRAFTELRYQLMPSAILEGRYKKIPVDERICVCGCGQIEDLTHYMMTCPLYANPRARFLDPIMQSLHGYSVEQTVLYLLADIQSNITHAVALFAVAAKKLRSRFTQTVKQ